MPIIFAWILLIRVGLVSLRIWAKGVTKRWRNTEDFWYALERGLFGVYTY